MVCAQIRCLLIHPDVSAARATCLNNRHTQDKGHWSCPHLHQSDIGSEAAARTTTTMTTQT